MTAVLSPLVAAVGGAAVVLGEVDDSPGLGGIGLLLVLGAVAANVRQRRAAARG